MTLKVRRSKAHLFKRPDDPPPIEATTRVVEMDCLSFVPASAHADWYIRPQGTKRNVLLSLPRVKWMENANADM